MKPGRTTTSTACALGDELMDACEGTEFEGRYASRCGDFGEVAGRPTVFRTRVDCTSVLRCATAGHCSPVRLTGRDWTAEPAH